MPNFEIYETINVTTNRRATIEAATPEEARRRYIEGNPESQINESSRTHNTLDVNPAFDPNYGMGSAVPSMVGPR